MDGMLGMDVLSFCYRWIQAQYTTLVVPLGLTLPLVNDAHTLSGDLSHSMAMVAPDRAVHLLNLIDCCYYVNALCLKE